MEISVFHLPTMKQYCFVFFHLFFALALGWAQITSERPISGYERCAQKFPHANESEFIREGGRKGEATTEAKCFLHCILENEGLMSGNTINETGIIILFEGTEHKNKDELVSAAKACFKETDPADACNTAYKFSLCVEEAFKKIRESSNEPESAATLVEALF